MKNTPSNLEGILKNTPSKTTLVPSKLKLAFVLEGVLKNTLSNLEGVLKNTPSKTKIAENHSPANNVNTYHI